MLIDEDVWVTVRYRLYDSQGDAIEATERELTYLQGGYGAVFPAIEEALAGREVGYAATVHLEPEDSFGDYDAERVMLLPRASLPDDLEVGMTFDGLPGEGGTPVDPDDDGDDLFVVTDITDEAVVLDGNHPLAGMSLRFELRVTDVRQATDEEIERERHNAAEADEDDGYAADAGSDGLDEEPDSPDPEHRHDGGGASAGNGPRRLH